MHSIQAQFGFKNIIWEQSFTIDGMMYPLSRSPAVISSGPVQLDIIKPTTLYSISYAKYQGKGSAVNGKNKQAFRFGGMSYNKAIVRSCIAHSIILENGQLLYHNSQKSAGALSTDRRVVSVLIVYFQNIGKLY